MYAIKMVGSGRGKYRQVAWRQLFKDGSFNKSVFKKDGVRLMGKTERMSLCVCLCVCLCLCLSVSLSLSLSLFLCLLVLVFVFVFFSVS